MNFESIRSYLESRGYNETSPNEVREKLENLTDKGYVRARTIKRGRENEERFYLSSYIGEGLRKRRSLQGRGIRHDISSLLFKRWFGSVFLLFGIGFFIYSNFTLTGAVISSSGKVNPVFGLMLALIILGVILLVQSFKRK